MKWLLLIPLWIAFFWAASVLTELWLRAHPRY